MHRIVRAMKEMRTSTKSSRQDVHCCSALSAIRVIPQKFVSIYQLSILAFSINIIFLRCNLMRYRQIIAISATISRGEGEASDGGE